MSVKLSELRPGDKVLVEATITVRRLVDGTLFLQLPSKNDFAVYRDIDVKEIVTFAVKAGDCVKWDSHQHHGPGWGVISHISDGFAWIKRFNSPSDRVTVVAHRLIRIDLPDGYEDGPKTGDNAK
jgi:hypothetical protein